MHIVLNNTVNTRSLSDLVNQDGLHIKKHLLIRSDALNKIDEEDKKVLQEIYHLKRVIDLRCDNEVNHNPDVPMEGVKLHLIPILPSERVGVSKKGNAEEDFHDFIEAIHKSGAKSSIEFMEQVYKEIIVSPFSSHAYHSFLKTLLDDVQGATLWHCSAGKDRAGFATILILYILDFNLEDIIEDYLSTNQFYQDRIEQFVSKYGEAYRETLSVIFGVRREYIDVLFESIKQNYGSLDRYIEQTLHFTKMDKETLKKIYLEEKSDAAL